LAGGIRVTIPEVVTHILHGGVYFGLGVAMVMAWFGEQ
jgi:hypothetical protein